MEKGLNTKMLDSDFFITQADIGEPPVLAMVFGEMQPIGEIYTLDCAFDNGTLFKNLNMPFLGRNNQC